MWQIKLEIWQLYRRINSEELRSRKHVANCDGLTFGMQPKRGRGDKHLPNFMAFSPGANTLQSSSTCWRRKAVIDQGSRTTNGTNNNIVPVLRSRRWGLAAVGGSSFWFALMLNQFWPTFYSCVLVFVGEEWKHLKSVHWECVTISIDWSLLEVHLMQQNAEFSTVWTYSQNKRENVLPHYHRPIPTSV